MPATRPQRGPRGQAWQAGATPLGHLLFDVSLAAEKVASAKGTGRSRSLGAWPGQHGCPPAALEATGVRVTLGPAADAFGLRGRTAAEDVHPLPGPRGRRLALHLFRLQRPQPTAAHSSRDSGEETSPQGVHSAGTRSPRRPHHSPSSQPARDVGTPPPRGSVASKLSLGDKSLDLALPRATKHGRPRSL